MLTLRTEERLMEMRKTFEPDLSACKRDVDDMQRRISSLSSSVSSQAFPQRQRQAERERECVCVCVSECVCVCVSE